MTPSLILINPWIHDFAAYDLWSKPLGLLYLAGYLRARGFRIHLIDCLDIHHPGMGSDPSTPGPKRRAYGTGKFQREVITKPGPLEHVPRSYSRYGISRDLFIRALKEIERPAGILVTSLMTYWYPGVKETINLAREAHPGTPVILGGIYARLCREHALQFSGADLVINSGGLEGMESIVETLRGCGIEGRQPSMFPRTRPYPAFDLLNKIDYIPLVTSFGCPFRCLYCASHLLNPGYSRRDPNEVIEEILYWHRAFGVRDFAFYDDALLFESKIHISLILEGLIRLNPDLRFHTPNALHIREITSEVSKQLYHSGFRTIRLGLETSDMTLHHELDKKVSEGEFERAVKHLQEAGFRQLDIGAYILMGLPGQSIESVKQTIEYVGRTGAAPFLAEYSPLPHTQLWEKALAHSEYDLIAEPLFHNNTLLPCWDGDRRGEVPALKKRVREIRQHLDRH